MSADESFLRRWSRRKLGAAREPPAPEPAERVRRATDGAAGSALETAPPIDFASLPPIESIGAGSDIRAFLARGVPADLRQAALRRAWSADPAIRDFIGLAENAWDFTAPGGVPGFGSVTSEEVERLLAHLAGESAETESGSPALRPSSTEQIAAPDHDCVDDPAPELRADPSEPAPRHETATAQSRPPRQPRRRGGALPE